MYALLSLPFLWLVFLLDMHVLKTRVIMSRNFQIVLGIMLAFTLVFDQFFTGLPIVFYDELLTSGIKIWYAPIEDFAYTVAAVIGIGSLNAYLTKD